MIVAVSLIFFLILFVIFFNSPRQFFAMSIFGRSLANMLVDVKIISIGGATLSFPDILAIFTLLFGFGFLISKWQELIASSVFRPAAWSLLLFIFFTGLTALADGVSGLIETAKVTSWLIYLPLGFILFSNRDGLKTLKKTGIYSAIFLIIGVAIGNYLKLGNSAYDMGILYLGFYTSEASLSSALLGSMAFFLIPDVTGKPWFLLTLFYKLLILVLLGLIVMVTLRSAILALFILIVVYFMLNGSAGFFRTSITIVGATMLLTTIVAGVIISNPKLIDTRFKDVEAYQAGGEVTSLGSGRVSLLVNYYSEYRSQSIVAQLFGTDFYTNSSQADSKTFKAVKYGTHNDVLQILFLSGLVGLIFYVLIWVSIVFALLRSFKLPLNDYQRQISALGVGLICVYSIFIFHGGIYYIYFMQTIVVIIGAAVGSSYYAYQKQESTDDSKRGISSEKNQSFIY